MNYPKTPELDKMKKIQEKSQEIGYFLDWLNAEKSWILCKMFEGEEDNHTHKGDYLPAHFNIEKLLAEYFRIDLQKVEKERRAILEAIREEK